MPLKAAKQWTRERCERKIGMVLGPLEAYVRRHRRRTMWLGLAFIANVVIIIPFFAGMPWHEHWRTIGNPLLFLCLVLYLALVFESGWTFIHWQYVRELRKSEWGYLKGTRQIQPQHEHHHE